MKNMLMKSLSDAMDDYMGGMDVDDYTEQDLENLDILFNMFAPRKPSRWTGVHYDVHFEQKMWV